MPSATALRQPTRRLPLTSTGTTQVQDLGVVGLRCRVTLHLAVEVAGPPAQISFVVDSGASYSVMSLASAQRYHVSMNLIGPEVILHPTTAHGATPMRVRPGRVRAWWSEELHGHPFDWPVLFRVDAPVGVPSILGLGGIVKTCRWTFDGSYSPDSPYGFLTLDDIR
jgi:hypothetical protein